jgi:hypothetical protein
MIMKQIDYFKFLKNFPELIDIDDTAEVKIVLLKEIKKSYMKLLPVSWKNFKITTEEFKNKLNIGDHYYIKIMFKKQKLFSAHIIKYKNINGKKIEILPEVHFQRDLKNIKLMDKVYMTKEEITNLKRTILIDNMIE